VKFRSTVSGYITGVSFFKTPGNSGTHIGELYNSAGTRLAQAVFANESIRGWQTVQFTTPIPIAANTTYIAAYFSPLEFYTATNFYFVNPAVNSPLTALADGFDGPNGVYNYNSSPIFPNTGGNQANYWIDVIFSYTNPGTIPTRTNHRIYFKARP